MVARTACGCRRAAATARPCSAAERCRRSCVAMRGWAIAAALPRPRGAGAAGACSAAVVVAPPALPPLTPQSAIMTSKAVWPERLPQASIALTTP